MTKRSSLLLSVTSWNVTSRAIYFWLNCNIIQCHCEMIFKDIILEDYVDVPMKCFIMGHTGMVVVRYGRKQYKPCFSHQTKHFMFFM